MLYFLELVEGNYKESAGTPHIFSGKTGVSDWFHVFNGFGLVI
jgi:hypothetical protein